MPDREKVIKGLECLYENKPVKDCENCSYGMKIGPHWGCDFASILGDALALLKAQEPRVMTVEEAKSAFVVEYRSGKMREVGSALLDLNVDPLNAEYGKIYRVWTSRPTDEQRKKEPWNG